MKLITASALALSIVATPVLADNHTTAAATPMETGTTSADLMGMRDMLIRTRDITGGEVYTMNEADDEGWDDANGYGAIDSNWNEIGEIEDIVLSRDGQMKGIVAEVGGFLDIGDKHVMIALDDVRLVATDDKTYSFVTRLSEEQLEQMEGVDEGFWD
ncbi:PRC-barrel domain-containing protein [Oceaniglobus indicus]|uniref:PRC-barrel domain-containing protein n=1 Tax=Oceaniglobus indicus TaxID=2047749 RepID=UPI000C19C77A|nr:PRC-barrel domain-containing protein [Oceaniglobus indicus]